jgi:hypothetical protein
MLVGTAVTKNWERSVIMIIRVQVVSLVIGLWGIRR